MNLLLTNYVQTTMTTNPQQTFFRPWKEQFSCGTFYRHRCTQLLHLITARTIMKTSRILSHFFAMPCGSLRYQNKKGLEATTIKCHSTQLTIMAATNPQIHPIIIQVIHQGYPTCFHISSVHYSQNPHVFWSNQRQSFFPFILIGRMLRGIGNLEQ